MLRKCIAIALVSLMVLSFAGCGNQSSQNASQELQASGSVSESIASESSASTAQEPAPDGEPAGVSAVNEPTEVFGESGAEQVAPEVSATAASSQLPDLEIRFGRQGAPFTIQMADNATAAEIARLVGQSDWNLPIYNYDDFEGWEYMQYYDIPSRYDIPSNAEAVTSAKAGEVYYSHPNRMILFYHDAEISAEYTRVGTIAFSDDFVTAVEENPVQEGWGNKIVSISRMD